MSSSSGRNCCLPDCCSRSDSVPFFLVTTKRLDKWSRFVDTEYEHSKFLRPYKLKLNHQLCALHFRSEDIFRSENIPSYEVGSLGKPNEIKRISVQKTAVPVFIRRSDVDLAIMSGKCGPPNMMDYKLLCRLRSIQPPSNPVTHDGPVLPATAPSLFPCCVLYPKCFMAFSTQAELMTHRSTTHEKDRPFICPVVECQKRFKTAVALKKHEPMHTEEKYKCPVCSKELRARSVSNFYKHLNFHRKQGEIPPIEKKRYTKRTGEINKCPVCSKELLSNSNFYKHLSQHRKRGEVPIEEETPMLASGSSATDDLSTNQVYPPDSFGPLDTNSFLDVKIKLEIDNPSDSLIEDSYSGYPPIPETEFVNVELYTEGTVKQEEPEFNFENDMDTSVEGISQS